MSKAATRRINLYINGQEVRNDISSISKEAKKLTNELAHMTRGSKEYNQTASKVKHLNGLIKEHNAGLRTTSQTLGNLKAGWLAIGAVFYGVMRGFGNFIEHYQKQEQAVKKVQQAIISTNGATGLSFRELAKEASNLQSKSIFGDEEILDKVTTRLLGYTDIQGEMFSKAQLAVLDMSAALGQDLASSAETVGKALNYPSNALAALSKQGFRFTEEQKKLIKNFEETNQLAKAQEIVLGELNLAYGGQAAAAAKGIGAIQQAKNAIGDLKEGVGALLAKGLTPLYEFMGKIAMQKSQLLTDIFKSTNERYEDQLHVVTNLVTAIGPLAQRYDELTKRSKLSTREQDELNEIIKLLAENVPFAATEFDEYGNAVKFSTDRITEHIERQKELLQYINRDAIRNVEKDIAKVDKELAKIAPHISEIEKTGTFKHVRRYYDEYRDEWLTGYRDASKTMVEETIATNQRLLAERRGMMTRLDELTGNALEKEIERRREEREAAKKSKSGIKEVETAYEILTKQIAKARKEMEAFVSAGQFDQAKQTGLGIAALEAQKLVLDGIMAAGGDVIKFLDDLTDSEAAALQETADFNQRYLNEFSDIFDEIADKRERHRKEEMDRETRRREYELEQERLAKEKKIQYEKDVAQAKQQITDEALSNAFSLLRQYIDAGYQRQVTSLDLLRNAELANETLTNEQRQKITEKYQKKEAALKEQAFKRQRRADIIQSLINGYLSVSRALSSPPGWPANAPSVFAAGLLAAIQTVSIAAQPVPQFSEGKYDVIGANDKRKYRARYIGKPKTGIIKTPSLISELGPEMIIDSRTLARLNPEIIRTIHAARFAPQYREGRYLTDSKQKDHLGIDLGFVEEFKNSVSLFSSKVDQLKNLQIEAYIIYQKFQQFNDKVDKIEKLSEL